MTTQSINSIVSVLRMHGEVFTGGPDREVDIAREWLGYGFDAHGTDRWCSVGVWEPSIAAQLRDARVSPARAKARSESLVEAIEEAGGDPAETYTDGCPIYAVCNGDTDVSVLMAREERFAPDHIHTTPAGRHYRHGDGAEVDGDGNAVSE